MARMSDAPQAQYNPNPKKVRGWRRKVSRAMKKLMGILRDLTTLVGELLQHALELATFIFSVGVKIGVSPIAPIVCAIALFLIVATAAFTQWWLIGGWVARIFGIPGPIGMTCSLLIGLGLNLFQLAPKLRKLDRTINRAYARLGINPNHETDEGDDPKKLEQNWFSENHRHLKIWSGVSYCVEAALVLGYAAVGQGLAIWAILLAAVSLTMPEISLVIATHTISLLGAVSRQVAYEEAPEEGEL